jgi:hypothetical protein
MIHKGTEGDVDVGVHRSRQLLRRKMHVCTCHLLMDSDKPYLSSLFMFASYADFP